jgi:hypothetical protein
MLSCLNLTQIWTESCLLESGLPKVWQSRWISVEISKFRLGLSTFGKVARIRKVAGFWKKFSDSDNSDTKIWRSSVVESGY